MNIAHKIDDCYGCGVCVIACPKDIIGMKRSTEGFYVPTITEPTRCIDCSLCEKVCSYLDDIKRLEPENIKGYAAYSKDARVRRKCTSGGVGFEIAKLLINKGYKACGVEYNYHENRAEHFVARTISEFKKSMGSKYIQSFTTPGFCRLTANDKWVVFGTPCQVDSLRKWLRIKGVENNYVLVDFFCHGVPSYLLWDSYLNAKKEEFHFDNIDNVNFRDKRNGWHSYTITIKSGNREKASSLKENDLFHRFFLSNLCLNKACYQSCKFKEHQSSADIRIGDFWGETYAENEEGISGVLANTEKGLQIIDELKTACVVKEEPAHIVGEGQMKGPLLLPQRRRYVMKNLQRYTPLKYLFFKIRLLNKVDSIFHKLIALAKW
ncbi:Coenzyme F420 hydrogenase/dehydrogenase, beta subunit C-terminal domain [Desulforhabdus sp. TSK]|uniref:Coenzyme F420 hydrogenase/dehydrogenase, beta subunit C-terminal domain n=1 Tax=Desulforhabdus sp. TSK TaxID=2925014 RepID=UPI001FC87669|nr:Coenzyme F420 hydrogenase/dehydrogenase, beta subunit C-terminal domain [Desulforhabdus sp. TSK]GKT08604.1 F420H2-dehydrogenase [Desulforhabdus sp. TSK]